MMNNKAYISMQKLERMFKYNDIDVLKLTIDYPIIRLLNSFAELKINNQILCEIYSYLRHADYLYGLAVNSYNQSKENDYPFHMYEAYMKYTITYNDNCFLSNYVDKYEFTGGAHGSTVRSSSTWELNRGTEIPLYAYFKPGTDYKQMLLDEITKQANNNLAKNPGIYFEDYKDLISSNFDENSYYLTQDGLVIYYQQYNIAPYSTGIVEFVIPYEFIGWYPHC